MVLLKVDWHLNPVAVVVGAALSAGAGRFLLATAAGWLRAHLNSRRQASLQAVDEYLNRSRRRSVSEFAVFVPAPLPSAQMFEAAGLMGLRLVPITVAFVIGRLVSFSVYIGATTVVEQSLSSVLLDSVTSVYGVSAQIALLAMVVVLARVDTGRNCSRHHHAITTAADRRAAIGSQQGRPLDIEVWSKVYRRNVFTFGPTRVSVGARTLRPPGVGGAADRLTTRLEGTPEIDMLLSRVLDTALEMTGAHYGDVQLIDPSTGALLLTTESGFDTEFLEYFAVVEDVGSACGRAVKAGQTAVFDVDDDAGFAPHRDIAASAGFRGVQSTPLLDYSGRVVGIVSTHFRDPHRPSDEELHVLRMYADFAGDAISRRLGGSDGVSDPIGRAMVSALLSGRTDPRADIDDGDCVGGDLTRPPVGGLRTLTSLDPGRDFTGDAAVFAATSDRLVRHLFDFGLQLHLLQAIFANCDSTPQDMRAASDAVTGILGDLDMLTRDAGLAMLALAREQAARPTTVRRNAIRRKPRR
ncbi:GAF domain-containing protein [Nocardia sp. CDC153]|uniref:GAF domain-containing protein n=1 Tax=Nocardia sp. CDC153 TaxID=3112167 RepID=UPI002DBD0369|nr:GAF domain-containing protein [Nocardia sp. CDC153]MEC3953734.1 GAF domain-containing protein [Nocardia sp. CDC153]